MSDNDKDFSKYKELILHELERMNNKLEELLDKYNSVHIEIVTLKTKAGIWGGIAGGVIGVVSAIIGGLVINLVSK